MLSDTEEFRIFASVLSQQLRDYFPLKILKVSQIAMFTHIHSS